MKSSKGPGTKSKTASKGFSPVKLSPEDMEIMFPGEGRKSTIPPPKAGKINYHVEDDVITYKETPTITRESLAEAFPIRKKGQKLSADYEKPPAKGELSFGDKTLLFMRMRSMVLSLQERGLRFVSVEVASSGEYLLTVVKLHGSSGEIIIVLED